MIDSNVASMAKREASIDYSFKELTMQLDRYAVLADNLGSRLNRVLTEDNTTSNPDSPGDEMPSNLSATIMSNANTLRYINNRLENLVSRIDL